MQITHTPTPTHAYMYTTIYTYIHVQYYAVRRLRLQLLMQYCIGINTHT